MAGICNQLASGSYYEGVVDLCLSVAMQRDQTGKGLHFYKNNEPSNDIEGCQAFSSRLECYRVIIDHLNQLIGVSAFVQSAAPPRIPNRPGPPTTSQEIPSSDAGQYAEQVNKLHIGWIVL